jgi:hypothetical protein
MRSAYHSVYSIEFVFKYQNKPKNQGHQSNIGTVETYPWLLRGVVRNYYAGDGGQQGV